MIQIIKVVVLYYIISDRRFDLFQCLRVRVFCLTVYLCTVCMQYLWRPETVLAPLGLKLLNSCSHVGARN